MLTLARFGHTKWLPEFLKHTHPDVTDSQGNWALHIAAEHGHFEFYNALLGALLDRIRDNGVYNWPKNNNGETPLHSAAIEGQVNFLIQCVATHTTEHDLLAPTASGDTIMHLLVRHGRVKSLEKLLEHFDFLSVHSKNQGGKDPLMLSLCLLQQSTSAEQRKQCHDIARILLKQHIDLANRDGEGQTALHLAVQTGDRELIEQLLAKGASLDICDNSGKYPEEYVSSYSEIGILLKSKLLETKRDRPFQRTPKEWRNLVFEGGGIKGLAYPSALRAMMEENICSLDRIQRVGGTSAGPVFALLVALGYSLDEMDHLIGIKILMVFVFQKFNLHNCLTVPLVTNC